MTQIKHLAQACGKTVKHIKETHMDEGLCIVFTDNSYIFLTVDNNYGDIGISEREDMTDEGDMFEVGLISKSERDTVRKEKAQIRKEHEKERELANYLKLKDKFEKETQA